MRLNKRFPFFPPHPSSQFPVSPPKCAHMTPLSVTATQEPDGPRRGTMLTLPFVPLRAAALFYPPVRVCVCVFSFFFFCVLPTFIPGLKKLRVAWRLAGVTLLILAWRLSDPAPNPPAHQISCLCAFVGSLSPAPPRPWLPKTYVISRPAVSARGGGGAAREHRSSNRPTVSPRLQCGPQICAADSFL